MYYSVNSVPVPSPVGLVYTFLIFLICEMNWVDPDMSELLNVSDGASKSDRFDYNINQYW